MHFSQQSNTEMGSWTLIEAKADESHRDASRDLFLWAVVQKNKELAEIAWEQVSEAHTVCARVRAFKRPLRPPEPPQCKDCMAAALAANKILKKMAQEESDVDEAQEMLELASHYEKHATGTKTF